MPENGHWWRTKQNFLMSLSDEIVFFFCLLSSLSVSLAHWPLGLALSFLFSFHLMQNELWLMVAWRHFVTVWFSCSGTNMHSFAYVLHTQFCACTYTQPHPRYCLTDADTPCIKLRLLFDRRPFVSLSTRNFLLSIVQYVAIVQQLYATVHGHLWSEYAMSRGA